MMFHLIYPAKSVNWYRFKFTDLMFHSFHYELDNKHWLLWIDQENKVNAMIQLAENYEHGEIILQFFEIVKAKRGIGHSSIMIDELVKHLKTLDKNIVVVRTTPSVLGEERLFSRLSRALDSNGIQWKMY